MSDTCTVPGCRRLPGDAFVCPRCATDLVRALTEHPGASTRPGRAVHGMAALVTDLEVAASRGSRLAAAGGAQSGETPLAWGYGAAEALWVLNSTLGTWVRDLCESRAVPIPMMLLDVVVWPRAWVRRTLARPTQVVGCAMFLAEHKDTVRQDVAGGQLVDEVRAAVTQARAAVDRPTDRTFCGRCTGCGTELLAPPGAHDVACPACGRSHSVRTRQQAMLDQVRGYIGTATEVSTMLRSTFGIAVSVQTISKRKGQGRLVVRGWDPDGHPRYRIGDVIDLAQDDERERETSR